MNYYYLIAGLPNLSIQDTDASFSPEEIKNELLDGVSRKDRFLLELYLLKHDNANLLTLLKTISIDGNNGSPNPDTDTWEDGGIYTRQELYDIIREIQNDAEAEIEAPAYMKKFLAGHFHADQDASGEIYAPSLLSHFYYQEALGCGNATIAAWFELNLNIGNLLTAANSRRLGLDATPYIIGSNDMAKALRSSRESDWGLKNEVEYFDEIMTIANETDALDKERKLDDFRWERIDTLITFNYFGIEQLFAFLVKIDIIRRWTKLDADKGEEKLRDIIAQLKEEVK